MSMISVIVPVYNVESYITRCVESVLAQTFTDFDLILVDDGSPDNCGTICDKYAAKDRRIHVIHKENGGLSDARNAGIDWAFAESNSEWLTFIDSDDWVHTKYLEGLLAAIITTGCEISICSYLETKGNTQYVYDYRINAKVVNTETFFIERTVNAVISCAKLYKKELFSQIRYPVGRLHEDEFTTYKLLFCYNHIAYVDAPLYYYYVNHESITKSMWSPQKLDGVDAAEEQLDFFKKRAPIVYQTKKDKHLEFFLYLRNTIIPESGIDDIEKYQRIVTKRLRRALWKYRAFPIRKYGDCYVTAYPFLGKLIALLKHEN